MSCQPCGCDMEMDPPHFCERHQTMGGIDQATKMSLDGKQFWPNDDPGPQPIKTVLPTGKVERKQTPIYSGVLKYFPKAIAEVARVSYIGNEQHNPGEPLHWAREKSTDQHDCLVRHLMEAGTLDTDGMRHSAKVAWRALAMLELELEGE